MNYTIDQRGHVKSRIGHGFSGAAVIEPNDGSCYFVAVSNIILLTSNGEGIGKIMFTFGTRSDRGASMVLDQHPDNIGLETFTKWLSGKSHPSYDMLIGWLTLRAVFNLDISAAYINKTCKHDVIWYDRIAGKDACAFAVNRVAAALPELIRIVQTGAGLT